MSAISNFFADLMSYHFLQNAVVTGLVIGLVSGVIGCFIVLRGMSMMGDAISHAVLPGVAVSYLLGMNFFIGAVVFGMLAAVSVTYIRENSIIKGDTAIGITVSAFLALGMILIGLVNSSTDLFHIIFGNILAVQDVDKYLTIVVSFVVLVVIWLFYKELLVTSFDPVFAKSVGMKVNRYHYLLMLLLSVVSVTAMQSVGTILIIALLITPAASSYLYVNNLKQMMLLSSLFGVFSSLAGIFIGYTYNIAVGSTIVLVATLLFAVSFVIAPKGILRKKDIS